MLPIQKCQFIIQCYKYFEIHKYLNEEQIIYGHQLLRRAEVNTEQMKEEMLNLVISGQYSTSNVDTINVEQKETRSVNEEVNNTTKPITNKRKVSDIFEEKTHENNLQSQIQHEQYEDLETKKPKLQVNQITLETDRREGRFQIAEEMRRGDIEVDMENLDKELCWLLHNDRDTLLRGKYKKISKMATATHPGTNPQKQKLIQICKDMTCGNNEMNIQQLEKELLASLFNEKCTLGCKEQKQDTNVTNVCIAYLTPDLTVNEEPQAHCSYSYADFPNKDQFNDIMEISSDEDSVQLVGTCAVTNMQLEKKKVNTVYTEANQPKDFSKNLAEQRNEMDVNQIAQDLLSSIFSEEVNQNEKTCHVYWMSNLESSSEVQNTDSGVILANEYKFPLFDPTDMNINNEHDSDELVIDTDYETSDEETVNE